MSKRFAWLLGVAGLVAIGLLVACGTTYNHSSDGLVVVGSQGSGLLETFSFSLSSGNISAVSNPPPSNSNQVCALAGLPSSLVLDPAGAYAYAIINQSLSQCGSSSANGIQAFKVNSDGTIATSGSLVAIAPDFSLISLAMDPAGKFLFVLLQQQNAVPGSVSNFVSSYTIGSGGALTTVPATYNLALSAGFTAPTFLGLAPSPTVNPPLLNGGQNGVCAGSNIPAPTSEFLYVTDSINKVVWEFGVDTSTGAVTNPAGHNSVLYTAAGQLPVGVAVDPCDRFVYVTDQQANQIFAYTICSGRATQSSNCPQTPDGSLNTVVTSPLSLPGNGPGPLLVDPFGNTVYVLYTGNGQSSQGTSLVTPLHIASVSGALVAGKSVSTGVGATSLAIRSDDSWLFVTNFTAATMSQYSITPNGGALSQQPAVTTDNYPWGVAVK